MLLFFLASLAVACRAELDDGVDPQRLALAEKRLSRILNFHATPKLNSTPLLSDVQLIPSLKAPSVCIATQFPPRYLRTVLSLSPVLFRYWAQRCVLQGVACETGIDASVSPRSARVKRQAKKKNKKNKKEKKENDMVCPVPLPQITVMPDIRPTANPALRWAKVGVALVLRCCCV